MSNQDGSLSQQEIKRLQGGELIQNGYDNDEIADIVSVTASAVRKWRKKLKGTSKNPFRLLFLMTLFFAHFA